MSSPSTSNNSPHVKTQTMSRASDSDSNATSGSAARVEEATMSSSSRCPSTSTPSSDSPPIQSLTAAMSPLSTSDSTSSSNTTRVEESTTASLSAPSSADTSTHVNQANVTSPLNPNSNSENSPPISLSDTASPSNTSQQENATTATTTTSPDLSIFRRLPPELRLQIAESALPPPVPPNNHLSLLQMPLEVRDRLWDQIIIKGPVDPTNPEDVEDANSERVYFGMIPWVLRDLMWRWFVLDEEIGLQGGQGVESYGDSEGGSGDGA